MKKMAVLLVVMLPIVIVLWCWHATRSTPRDARPAPDAVAAHPPNTPGADPSAWPSGDALRVSLAPDVGALTLTKSLFWTGDTVLEQTWPDGTRERWWYAHDGRRVYIGRDGRRSAKDAGGSP